MIKDTIAANEAVAPNSREMEVLKENFPACFHADGSFDIERFKEFLSDKVSVVHEGYELRFLGKNYARLLASLDTTTVIVPDEEHNAKPENKNSENIYISGDNLDGLKHLLKSYARKVKCIYIDPPYNTGTDDFVYRDTFDFTVDELATKLSINEVQAQHILDLTKRGSASHSAWLMFMYPRLLLARELLTDDGAFFISINDVEQGNLELICNDVFGEENFIGNFIWMSKSGGGSDNGTVVTDQEYVLGFAKKNSACLLNRITIQAEELDKEDDKGKYRRGRELNKWGANSRREDRPTMFFPIQGPNGEDVYPIRNDGDEGCWRWGRPKMLKAVENGDVEFVPRGDGTYIVYEKIRSEDPRLKPHRTFIEKCGTTADGTKAVKELFDGKKVFDYAKPIGLLEFILKLGISSDDVLLDFFSGSATTAHVALAQAVSEEQPIPFIMIQLPEKVKENSIAEQEGFKTVDEIGMARIIRAAAKIREEHPDTTADLGFKHFTLMEPPQNTLDKLEVFDPDESAIEVTNTILDDFGLPTVLTTWLVRDGYGFHAPVQQIDFAGYPGYYANKHLYLISPNLTNAAIEAIVTKYETDGDFNPENVVLFGYSFLWTELETLKTNLKRLKDTEKNLRINFDIRY